MKARQEAHGPQQDDALQRLRYMRKDARDVNITFRTSRAVKDALESSAAKLGVTESDVIRLGLERMLQYLGMLPQEAA